jgi:hypothetical protein
MSKIYGGPEKTFSKFYAFLPINIPVLLNGRLYSVFNFSPLKKNENALKEEVFYLPTLSIGPDRATVP